MPEFFDVINEKNEVIGKAERKEAHRKGLLHRGVHVGVFNSKGEIFLTKRAASKDVFPNRREDMGESVKSGESYEKAALRGLKEELGIRIKNAGLIELGFIKSKVIYDKIKDREISKVYKCVFDGKIRLDLNEVAEGKFFKLKELEKEIKEKPEKFTEWLKKTFELYSK